jgi:hypothetical protein
MWPVRVERLGCVRAQFKIHLLTTSSFLTLFDEVKKRR